MKQIKIELTSEPMIRVIQANLPLIKQMLENTRWCDYLRIINRANQDGSGCAEIDMDIRYNHALLILYPNFVDSSSEEQTEYLRHELFHLVTAPAIDWATEMFKDLQADKLILREFRNRVENVVQDLARNYRPINEP